MRWQMGIQGGHYDFIELFTWWRNPWPKDFVDYKYEKRGDKGFVGGVVWVLSCL
jgi:hypothetical protein